MGWAAWAGGVAERKSHLRFTVTVALLVAVPCWLVATALYSAVSLTTHLPGEATMQDFEERLNHIHVILCSGSKYCFQTAMHLLQEKAGLLQEVHGAENQQLCDLVLPQTNILVFDESQIIISD